MKKAVSLVFAMLMLMAFVGTAYAADPLGSLTIQYTRKDTSAGVSEVELSVFQAGSPTGSGYALTEAFSDAEVDLNALHTTDQEYTAAETLYRYVTQKNIAGISKRTNGSGRAVFDNLSAGVYLVAQTQAKEGYKTISPYIVFIPEESVFGSLRYHILSNVKTEFEDSGSSSKLKSISVSKIWDDSENADGIRPDCVSVTLLQKGVPYKTVLLSSSNHWKHTFFGLSGSLSDYSVEEMPVEGYTATLSGSAAKGFVITNQHHAVSPPEPEKPSIWVQKKWDDNDNKAGLRPNSVTIQLIKDKTVYRTAELNNANDWSFCFTDLPDASYTVKEISVKGYSASYSRADNESYVITNTFGNQPDDLPLPPEKTSTPSENGLNDGQTASDATIPQTGSLNWPIPPITATGVSCILIGIRGLSRKKRKSK